MTLDEAQRRAAEAYLRGDYATGDEECRRAEAIAAALCRERIDQIAESLAFHRGTDGRVRNDDTTLPGSLAVE